MSQRTKMAREPTRPIVRVQNSTRYVQNGPQLYQKWPTATSKMAHMDVQNSPQLG